MGIIWKKNTVFCGEYHGYMIRCVCSCLAMGDVTLGETCNMKNKISSILKAKPSHYYRALPQAVGIVLINGLKGNTEVLSELKYIVPNG